MILKEIDPINQFEKDLDITSWIIANPEYNKLNKLKKTSPEAFYYFFQALTLLELKGK